MSHVAARNADKKPGEPVQVKVAEASTKAALLRMMGPRQEKERLAEGAGAEPMEQAPPPAAAAAALVPAAGASPAKQSKNREATPNRPREGTPGAGTPAKSPRNRAEGTPAKSPRVRPGSAGGA